VEVRLVAKRDDMKEYRVLYKLAGEDHMKYMWAHSGKEAKENIEDMLPGAKATVAVNQSGWSRREEY
jgi:hypothetical protein